VLAVAIMTTTAVAVVEDMRRHNDDNK